MLAIAQYWIAASYVLALGVAVDQLRRPVAEWEAAGRQRRFWVALTLIMGFHGLGEYAAVAYLGWVVPRFHARQPHEPRGVLRRATKLGHTERSLTAAEELALVAAVLTFASSIIHSAVIADHVEEHWLIGAFFVVVTIAQAVWAVLVYGDPLNRRVLVAGAVGSAAIAVVWAISRTVGIPIGPHPWRPEAVGRADVLSTLCELGAAALVAVVLARSRGARSSLTGAQVRIATMLAGPLFIYSVLSAFGGGHHHHLS
jgi:hypothetical protein